ncbi:unnamed protein product [Pylaiella littoralis]
MAERERSKRKKVSPAELLDTGVSGAAAGLGSSVKPIAPRVRAITGTSAGGARPSGYLSGKSTDGAERTLAVTAISTDGQFDSLRADSSKAGSDVSLFDDDDNSSSDDVQLLEGGKDNSSGESHGGRSLSSCEEEEEEEEEEEKKAEKEDDSDDAGDESDDRGDVGGSNVAQGGASKLNKAKVALKKSVDRNSGKPYAATPTTLLREMCATRKVTGVSRKKNPAVLAKALSAMDGILKRPSPFWADMEDRVAGGTPASAPPAPADQAGNPPATLVAAVRAAIKNGANVSKTKMYDYGKFSYTGKTILAVIKTEDAADREGEVSTAGRRKSKIVCLDGWHFWSAPASEMELPLARHRSVGRSLTRSKRERRGISTFWSGTPGRMRVSSGQSRLQRIFLTTSKSRVQTSTRTAFTRRSVRSTSIPRWGVRQSRPSTCTTPISRNPASMTTGGSSAKMTSTCTTSAKS